MGFVNCLFLIIKKVSDHDFIENNVIVFSFLTCIPCLFKNNYNLHGYVVVVVVFAVVEVVAAAVVVVVVDVVCQLQFGSASKK